MSAAATPFPQTALHFTLTPGKSYTLKAFGRAYPLAEHTAASLRLHPEAHAATYRPTHFAYVAAPSADVIQLLRIYGTAGPDGIRPLESLAVYTPGSQRVYSTDDLAKAILFLHPNLTVLTAESAPAVLHHIGSAPAFGQMSFTMQNLGRPWNTITKIRDAQGNYLRYPSGEYVFQYDLDPELDNLRAAVARDAAVSVNSDESLRNIRWGVQTGEPFRDISPPPGVGAAFTAVASGYQYDLQDAGPRYGISCRVLDLTDDFQIKIRLTNNYIRHCSTFVSFIGGDGKTALIVPDNIWTTLLDDVLRAEFQAWTFALTGEALDIVFDNKNTLKFLGTLGAETTFMGIPVSTTSSDYTFQLPDTGTQTISKVRVVTGSLGIPSGNDWDPQAAWIGIGMTALLDIMIPTIALAATVGLASNKLVGTVFSNILFMGPIVANTALAVYDSVINPDLAGKDVANLLTAIGSSLLQRILTASDIAELVALFATEEVVEAIPIVGWALKAEVIEATIEQLAQTVGEVVGSERVVEFDITVTLTVKLKLVPADASGFPATATRFTITAQYTDLKGYVYTAEITDAKVFDFEITWDKMPVGGTVTFVVAFYSKEGWLVGKGQSQTIPNLVTQGQGALVVPPIAIHQLLYPLDSQTTYGHSQILQYSNGTHHWTESPNVPPETAKDLGTGAGGNVLDALTSIGLNSDNAILGYCWQASGQNVPLIGTDTRRDEPLYTFQNISFGPDAEAALMFTPAGYNASPQLAYLRSAAANVNATPITRQDRSFFYLDPVADSAGTFHLRGITPVNDPNLPPDSPRRQFDLSTDESWGRFLLLPTSMAISAAGTVVAISDGFSKLQILDLPQTAGPSAKAKQAQVYSGPGTREGMVSMPQAVAIAPNQTILVLEAGNMRIQAFSAGGHPAKAFPEPTPYWFPLYTEASDPGSVAYVSMSVDVQGYIFVLSIEGNGYVANEFRLDVYTPDGHHLFRQRGINAAAMTVDLWRNLYTLDYHTILGPGNRTEPSVSEWIPSTPATSRATPKPRS